MGQPGEHFLTFGVGLGKLLEHGVMPFSELSYFLGPFGGNGPGAAVASSRDRFAELEDPTPRVRTDLDLVSSFTELERWEEAQDYLADALSVLEKRLESTPEHVHAHFYAGVLARQRGEERQAEGSLWQALELSQAFTVAPRRAAIHFELAELYGYQDRDGAVEHLMSAYKLARACSLPKLLHRTVERLHELSPRSLFDLLLDP